MIPLRCCTSSRVWDVVEPQPCERQNSRGLIHGKTSSGHLPRHLLLVLYVKVLDPNTIMRQSTSKRTMTPAEALPNLH